jgi:hypothetical protein
MSYRIGSCDDTEDLPATSEDLLGGGLIFLIERAWSIEEDRWKVFIDECDTPMLEFSTRICLRVTIGELLELERSFHRDREFESTTEVEEVLIFAIL